MSVPAVGSISDCKRGEIEFASSDVTTADSTGQSDAASELSPCFSSSKPAKTSIGESLGAGSVRGKVI